MIGRRQRRSVGGRLRARPHFGAIVKSGISSADVARVLRCFQGTLLPIILNRYPVSRLGFVRDPVANGIVRSGFLQKSTGRIYIKINDRVIGEKLVPGQTEFLSDAGASPIQTLAITLAHEIGHHLHLKGGTRAQRIIDDAFTNLGRGTPITDYADTVPEEYFAESFAAYMFFGSLLQTTDRIGYNMVEDVITTLMRTVR